jgi:hypothetical protein
MRPVAPSTKHSLFGGGDDAAENWVSIDDVADEICKLNRPIQTVTSPTRDPPR